MCKRYNGRRFFKKSIDVHRLTDDVPEHVDKNQPDTQRLPWTWLQVARGWVSEHGGGSLNNALWGSRGPDHKEAQMSFLDVWGVKWLYESSNSPNYIFQICIFHCT